MNIEVHQPRLEALTEPRMASGRFQSIEDALVQALEAAPLPETPEPAHRTGADLIAAMQAMPYRDEIEFEHSRPQAPGSSPEPESLDISGRSGQIPTQMREMLTDEEFHKIFSPNPAAPPLPPVEPGSGKRLVEAFTSMRGLMTDAEIDTMCRRQPVVDRPLEF